MDNGPATMILVFGWDLGGLSSSLYGGKNRKKNTLGFARFRIGVLQICLSCIGIVGLCGFQLIYCVYIYIKCMLY